MRILKDNHDVEYDIAIFGLGFESRSIALLDIPNAASARKIALGYSVNTEVINYEKNKEEFKNAGCEIYEGDDQYVLEKFISISKKINNNIKINVLLDITVMSRHRLATILCGLIRNLPEDSVISVMYSLSAFVQPPKDSTPIRTIGELADDLIGDVGDLSLPACAIFGLGYEPNKALGVSNYLDSNIEFALIPESPEKEFENFVIENNSNFLAQIPESNALRYEVNRPYSTYVNLKSLIMALKKQSRPIMIPLGPKVLSALSTVLGLELKIPVWRVSSDHEEIPVERSASGDIIRFDLKV